ncbi:MAG: tRNA (adenosine(37)-N6)-threonylcarbamoyltransferase complex ATPase subunit type 1 TsaE [Gammaproteobacteria bacterium]
MDKNIRQSGLKENAVTVEVPSAAAMESLGGKLARKCPPGCRIFVQGPLGAGKTTLIRGFLRSLGYRGTVKSPTYTLVEPYLLDDKTIYHFDFYRITSPSELESIGVRDYFDQTSICLVEWPEKGGSMLGTPDLLVHITLCEPVRRVDFQASSRVGHDLHSSLKGSES